MSSLTPTTERKPKILMLHGYTQSGPLFHAKTRAHSKLLSKSIPGLELIYPTAPILLHPADIPGYNPDSPSTSESYGWWTKSTTPTGEITYQGLEKGLQTIADAILAAEGIDGVIGFSQGATCAAFVASLLEEGRRSAFPAEKGDADMDMASATSATDTFPYPSSFSTLLARLPGQKPLKFAISYSGFIAPAAYTPLFTPKIATPFLHVIGSLDSVVEESRSIGLYEACEEGSRKLVYHPGGHFVPSGREMNAILVGFVKECLEGGKDVVVMEEKVEDMDVPF